MSGRAECYILWCFFFIKDLRWTIPESEKESTTKPTASGRCQWRSCGEQWPHNSSNAGDNNLAPVELDELAVGQYVALDKTEWSNRPLIGLVENIEPTTITVRWLDGSYNGTFRDSYVGSGANRRPWTEDMAKTQIVMIGVQFTNSRRIKKDDIDELRARYEIVDNEQETNPDNSA